MPDLSRSASLILIALGLTLAGCDVGYKVDVRRNTVTWVTWDEGNGRQESPVVGADAKTFQVLRIGPNTGRQQFGRDKTHVYREDKLIRLADPNTFREFGPRTYRDDKSVFRWVRSAIVQLPQSDPESFTSLEGQWSKDAERVFYEDRGFVPRDINSFEVLALGWARDREAIYYEDREVRQAHRDTFEVLTRWRAFGRDRDHVFWHGWLVNGADPQTFVGSSPHEGHDHKTRFYCIFNTKLEIIRMPVAEARAEKKP